MKSALFFLFTLCVSAESLHYSINYPSGLSLGDATLDSSRSQTDKGPGGWNFTLDIDAGIPGYSVRDHYHAEGDAELCSIVLTKKFVHGSHTTDEKINFDQQEHSVTRQTAGGGKSDFSVPSCARGAFSYLQFVRNELAQGRLPSAQPVVFGAAYDVRLEYTGTQTVKVGEQNVEAERIVANIKGPSTEIAVEIFFSRDKAHTPLLARLPLALGMFSVELVR
jgi:hypothetical protein